MIHFNDLEKRESIIKTFRGRHILQCSWSNLATKTFQITNQTCGHLVHIGQVFQVLARVLVIGVLVHGSCGGVRSLRHQSAKGPLHDLQEIAADRHILHGWNRLEKGGALRDCHHLHANTDVITSGSWGKCFVLLVLFLKKIKSF